MFSIHIHEHAVTDLEQLWQKDPKAAARIAALLEELEGDQDLLDRLTQHNFGTRSSSDFNVKKWLEHWRSGKDIWRIRIWDIEKYRVIYAYIPGSREYHVLAIPPRDFNYEEQHPITRRILADYEGL